jgi:hypothetical protein
MASKFSVFHGTQVNQDAVKEATKVNRVKSGSHICTVTDGKVEVMTAPTWHPLLGEAVAKLTVRAVSADGEEGTLYLDVCPTVAYDKWDRMVKESKLFAQLAGAVAPGITDVGEVLDRALTVPFGVWGKEQVRVKVAKLPEDDRQSMLADGKSDEDYVTRTIENDNEYRHYVTQEVRPRFVVFKVSPLLGAAAAPAVEDDLPF